MRDLDHLARTVVVANAQWWRGGDRLDQTQTAFSGLAEHLCRCPEPPTRNELLAAGTRALAEEVKGWRRDHGLRDNTEQPGPRFATYWYTPPAAPWEERVLERVALAQILPRIPAHDLDALTALAVHGDYAAAAEHLGIKYATLIARIRHARSRIHRLWYAPGTAPKTRGTDRRVGTYQRPLAKTCAAGHEWTPENTRWDRGRSAASARVRRCRACELERSRARRAAKTTP